MKATQKRSARNGSRKASLQERGKSQPTIKQAPKEIRKTASKSADYSSFPIVGIGASAGGLEAFTRLLQGLPTDTGMGFVLVQHLDPIHESALTKLLAKATSMPVREVSNNARVEPNRVYVIPPNKSLLIEKGAWKQYEL